MTEDIIDTLLAAMPGTRREIEKSTGLAKTTVFRRAAQLHTAGWCHISGWRGDGHGGRYQPVFKAGQGKDRVCTLQPLPPEVTQLRFREKARKSGAWADRAARIRARYYADKATKQPQSWLSALLAVPRAREAGRA